MEDSWPFGVAVAPDGERAREFVQRMPVWSSAIFLTEHGTAYRRYMSSRGFTSWELLPLTEEPESGRFGYHLPGFVAIETALATAFHPRAPGSRRRAYVLDPSAELHASNVAWRDPEVVVLDDDDDETWQPLRWRIGIASCDGLGFDISSRGRLRHGRAVTRGFAAHGTRWAATPVGLVDLLAAAQLQRHVVRLAPRLAAAYRSFSAGIPPEAHADLVGLSHAAWSYYATVAPYVARRRRLAREWVDEDVWQALEDLRGDPFLEGRLAELKAHVDAVVGRDVPFEHLRLARLCLL